MKEQKLIAGHSWWIKTFLYILISFFSSAIFSFLGVFVSAVSSPDGFIDVLMAMGEGVTDVMDMKILQIFSAIGMFIVPPIIFAYLVSPAPLHFLKMDRKVKIYDVFFVLLIVMLASPLVFLLGSWNQNMHLPDFMKSVEDWMIASEARADMIIDQFLKMETLADLMINLLMIGFLPALGEELVFRGMLQNSLIHKLNKHLAVWITAIIFSAIHLQFFGFLPRMMLGALFGYLLLWSGNIWLPIVAHFFFNSTQVIMAYFDASFQSNKHLESLDYFPNTLIITCSFAFGVLLFLFKVRVDGKRLGKGF